MSKRISCLIALLFLASIGSEATPLRLDYSKSWSASGIVYYTFTLALENTDESWVPGQSWGWLIFGDSPSLGGSPFNDFTMTGGIMGVGPWNSVTTSSGAHNGPTLGPAVEMWMPTSVGEFLTWQGYSTSNVPDGAMFFSTFFTGGGAVGADFQAATNLFPDVNFPNSPAFVPPVNGSPPVSSNSSSSSSSSSGGSSSSSSSSTSSGGDELWVQTVAVPEPASVGLTSAVLALLGWRLSRQLRRG